MRTEKIECDGCGADLTRTGNCVDWRVALVNQNIPSRGGIVTAMGVYPALNHDCYFCDLRCLDHWNSRRHHRSNLSKEWWEKWKADHGTEHKSMLGEGRSSWSYPVPPDDIQKSRDESHEAAALAAFPLTRSPR